MDLAERKIKIVKQFLALESEEKVLLLENFLKNELSSEDEIVATSILGEPLTMNEYKKRVLDANEAISNGDFTTAEDLLKESKNW